MSRLRIHSWRRSVRTLLDVMLGLALLVCVTPELRDLVGVGAGQAGGVAAALARIACALTNPVDASKGAS